MPYIYSVCCKKVLLSLLIALSCVFQAFAQQYYSGKVIGSDQIPIPYAHIQVGDIGLGTITNSNGDFKLYIPAHINISTINVSCIGYVPLNLTLTKPHVVIILKEDIKLLAEVIVTPRDHARELIEKAIANIPLNYPNHQEGHTGFFREMTYWEGNQDFAPIYIAEAVIKSLKKPYDQKSITGLVSLVEGRNYQSLNLDTLSTRIYAGAHIPHRFDIIARREEFLSHPNAYNYEIRDTTRFNNKDVFKISFNKKKGNLSGLVYVLDSSFAIIESDFKYKKFSAIDIGDWKRKFKNYTVSYSYGKDLKWRLKHVVYNTAFNMQKGVLNLSGEYITTNTEIEEVIIPYQERIQYADILLHKTGKYNPDFWKNFNITPDPKIEVFFNDLSPKQKDVERLNKNKRLNSLLSKLSLSYEMTYAQLELQNYLVTFANSQISLNQSASSKSISSIGISTGLQYRLKSNYIIGLKSVASFSKGKVESYDFELLKEININPKGRPIFLSPGLQIGHQKMSYFLDDFKSDNTFTISGKKFDSGETDLYLQQKGIRLQPLISIRIEKSERLRFVLTAGYNFILSSDTGLFFDETNQFFLKQKSAFLKNNNGGLLINHEGNLLENNFSLSFGLNFRLK
jgi:hypothetical protein